MTKIPGAVCLCVLVAVVLVAAGGAGWADVTAGPAFPICGAHDDQHHPAISGGTVVWEDERNMATSHFDPDIYGYDLGTGREFPICTAPGGQGVYGLGISGSIVVWEDGRNMATSRSDIYGYDLATGPEFPICTGPDWEVSPAISGSIVVWADWTSARDIHVYDLGTGREFPISTPQVAPGEVLALSGSIVVWVDVRSYATSLDIYGYDLGTGREFPICTASGVQNSPAISGSIVVWEDWRSGYADLYGYDLATGREFPICTGRDYGNSWPLSNTHSVAISGNIVVYQDARNYATSGWDIYGYDLATGREFPVCTASGRQVAPAISGTTVVWTHFPSVDSDIYGCYLEGVQHFPTNLLRANLHSHSSCSDGQLIPLPLPGDHRPSTDSPQMNALGFWDWVTFGMPPDAVFV